MSILSIFKRRTPIIITRLQEIRKELDDAQVVLNSFIENQDAFPVSADKVHSNQLISAAMEEYGIAIWLKDLRGKFLFVNKTCCETILHCTAEEALSAGDNDFEENALSTACMLSDQKVMSALKTMRFIEHGDYLEKHVFLDTIKSPLMYHGQLIGTAGSGKDISKDIVSKSEGVFSSCSVEVPLDLILCEDNLTEYLR